MKSPFKDLVQGIFELSKIKKIQITQFKKDSDRIHQKYSPRACFNRWRDSTAGQTWKAQQYLYQSGCCAICQTPIPLKGSHIDHKKPLSKNPELAVVTTNLWITCPSCNESKGADEGIIAAS